MNKAHTGKLSNSNVQKILTLLQDPASCDLSMSSTSPSMTLLWSTASTPNLTVQIVSDLLLAPAFHLVLDTVQSGEVYNLIIRGGNEGGLDGIDVWGFNMHIHDVEVTNKDECVTVKASQLPKQCPISF